MLYISATNLDRYVRICSYTTVYVLGLQCDMQIYCNPQNNDNEKEGIKEIIVKKQEMNDYNDQNYRQLALQMSY